MAMAGEHEWGHRRQAWVVIVVPHHAHVLPGELPACLRVGVPMVMVLLSRRLGCHLDSVLLLLLMHSSSCRRGRGSHRRLLMRAHWWSCSTRELRFWPGQCCATRGYGNSATFCDHFFGLFNHRA